MIYLLRHGEIEDARDRFIGQSDIPLTAGGRLQAEKWAQCFREAGVNFDAIFSSDLSRCLETARIICPGRSINARKELREINMGLWEGIKRAELKKNQPEIWKARGENPGHRPPEGESFADLLRRAAPLLDEILSDKKSGHTLVVTHAGVIRVALCHILNIPLQKLFSIGIDYSGLSVIDSKKEPYRIILMNKTL
jgi:probable phosphoglycerate mutase